MFLSEVLWMFCEHIWLLFSQLISTDITYFVGAPKINHSAMINAAKRNDYERVKILFKYGYRLEQKDNITDPLKKIELFKVWLKFIFCSQFHNIDTQKEFVSL